MALTASLLPACRDEARPRTAEEIFHDRRKIDTLYLTEDEQEIIAPASPAGAVVADARAGTLAWPAWQCNNPDCPGEGKGGRPYLFTWPDPFKFVADDGSVGVRQPENDEDLKLFEQSSEQKCPACLPQRNLAAETDQQRLQYQQWCQPYILPQAAEQLQELDEETRRYKEELERRRNRPVDAD